VGNLIVFLQIVNNIHPLRSSDRPNVANKAGNYSRYLILEYYADIDVIKVINDIEMNILKINNGKVELRKDNGSFIRAVGNGDAISADINDDGSLILITTVRGKVELRKESGSYIRAIGNGDASSARFSGKDILVTTNKGKTELRKESGAFIRTI
jgi:hypothetical protein